METRPSEVPGPGRQKHFLSTHRYPAPLQPTFRNNPFLNYLLGVRSCDIAIIFSNTSQDESWLTKPNQGFLDSIKLPVSLRSARRHFIIHPLVCSHFMPRFLEYDVHLGSHNEWPWVTRSHHVRFIPPRLLRDSASTCLKLDLGHAAKKPLLTNSITTALLTWTSLTWKNDEWRYAWASTDSTNSLKMM